MGLGKGLGWPKRKGVPGGKATHLRRGGKTTHGGGSLSPPCPHMIGSFKVTLRAGSVQTEFMSVTEAFSRFRECT